MSKKNLTIKGTEFPSFQIGPSNPLAGQPGATVYQGTSVPLNSLGNPGDLYLFIDTSTPSGPGSIPYIKAGGIWNQLFASNSSSIGGIDPDAGVFIVGNGASFVGLTGNNVANKINLGTENTPTFAGLNVSNAITANTFFSNNSAVSLFSDVGNNNIIVGGPLSSTIFAGNVLIQGSSTVVSSGTLEVADANIIVNKGGSTATALLSGVTIEGDGGNEVGYFRSGTTSNLLTFKAPTGSELSLNISSDTQLNLSGASINQVIKFDGTAFTNSNLTLGNISDVILSSPAINDFLQYNGTNWVNSPTIVGSGSVTSVSAIAGDGIIVSGSPITSSGTFELTLGTITPLAVSSLGNISGLNLSGTNTGDQTITLTGDITGSGTGTFTTTLGTSGVVAGTYNTVTVDVKGRVTFGTNVAVGAVTSIVAGTGLTGGTITNTGTIALGTSGVTAGTYNQVTVDALGRVTAGTSIVLNGSATTRTVTQTAHGFVFGNILTISGTNYILAQADSIVNAEAVGVVTSIIDANNFVLTTSGYVSGFSGLTVGSAYFLSPTVAGQLTVTIPTTIGQVVKPLLVADSATSGYYTNMRGQLIGAIDTIGLGTSGHVIPFLDGTNTWSAPQTFTSPLLASNLSGTNTGDLTINGTVATAITLSGLTFTSGTLASSGGTGGSVAYLSGTGSVGTVLVSGIALGNSASVSGTNGIAIGNSSSAGSNNVAIGQGVSSANGSLSVAIGANVNANASAQTVAIGNAAVGTGNLAVVIGAGGTASGAATAIGNLASATGFNSVAIGRLSSAGSNSSVVFGVNVRDVNPYSLTWAPGQAALVGDVSSQKLLAWAQTSGTAATELFLGGDTVGSSRFTLAANTTWAGVVSISALASNGTGGGGAALYQRQVCIERYTGGTIQFVGSQDVLGTDKISAGLGSPTISLALNTSLNALTITVTPANSTPTKWLAQFDGNHINF